MILLSFNIQYGFGADGRYDLARAASVMQGADIVALQEVDHRLGSRKTGSPALGAPQTARMYTVEVWASCT